MKEHTIVRTLVATFLAFGAVLWAVPCSAATLSKSQANAIVTAASKRAGGFLPQCYPLVTHSVTVRGKWAFVNASCHSNPDAAINAILRETGGKWSYACGHGDDVMYAQKAMKYCGMTHAEALALGFTDQP